MTRQSKQARKCFVTSRLKSLPYAHLWLAAISDFRHIQNPSHPLNITISLPSPFPFTPRINSFWLYYVLYIQFTVAYSRSTCFKWRKPTDLQWRWQSRWTKGRRGTRENRRWWIWTRPQSAISNGQEYHKILCCFFYSLLLYSSQYYVLRIPLQISPLCNCANCNGCGYREL